MLRVEVHLILTKKGEDNGVVKTTNHLHITLSKKGDLHRLDEITKLNKPYELHIYNWMGVPTSKEDFQEVAIREMQKLNLPIKRDQCHNNPVTY